MQRLAYPFLVALLWILRLLPKKPILPAVSQVRDTQPEKEIEVTVKAPAPQSQFTDITRNALTDHVDRNKRIIEAYQRLEAESEYRPAQEWQHIALPRHKRDLDLVNYLKREGKI